MDILLEARGWITLILAAAAFVAELFALVDAARQRPDAFDAAGKRTKGFWMALTAVAALVGLVPVLFGGIGLLAIVGICIAGVYLADVRPALREVTGRGGSTSGPYGSW